MGRILGIDTALPQATGFELLGENVSTAAAGSNRPVHVH